MSANFTMEPHYMMKAVAKAGIAFPISKADALTRAGVLEVRADYDKVVTLASILERMVPDFYENASVFYNAYMSAQTTALKSEYGF